MTKPTQEPTAAQVNVQTVRIAVIDCKNEADVHSALEDGMYWIAGPLENECAISNREGESK